MNYILLIAVGCFSIGFASPLLPAIQLTDNYDDIFHARQRREAYNMIEGTFHRRALLLATCWHSCIGNETFTYHSLVLFLFFFGNDFRTDCITVTSKHGNFHYKAASNDMALGVTCGLYFITDPDKKIEIEITELDLSCDGGVLSVRTFNQYHNERKQK